VLGEVKNPGAFPLVTQNALTPIKVIAQSGGFSDFARPGSQTRSAIQQPDTSTPFFFSRVHASFRFMGLSSARSTFKPINCSSCS